MGKDEKRGRLFVRSSIILILLSNVMGVYVFFSWDGVVPLLLIALFLSSVLLLWLISDGYDWARFVIIFYLLIVYIIGISKFKDLRLYHESYLTYQIMYGVSVALFVLAGIMLCFRSVSDYMYVRRYG